jgi:hypothetical protein
VIELGNSEKKVDSSNEKDLTEEIRQYLQDAAVDYQEKLKEEERLRAEIKEAEQSLQTSFEKESEEFQKRVSERFSTSRLDSLQEQLVKATDNGDLEEVSRILALLEGNS